MARFPIFLTACLCALMLPLDRGLCQEEKKQVTLQFVTFPKWTKRQPLNLLIGKGETLEITAPSNSFSKPYQVPKLDSWVFGDVQTGEDGSLKFEAFGQGKSLDSKNQLILIIRQGQELSDGIKVIALDGRLENFGGGEFFYYNASTFEMAGMMGKTKLMLKPGEYKIIKPSAEDIEVKGDMSFIQTVHFYRKGEVKNPLYNSTWHLNPKARSMIFFYQDNDAKRLKMHTLQHFMP